MSDALNIMTPFGDVASLGQGYAQRADGEHLWLPMPQPLEPGTGVEFVIFLADGTPAFAGAGQCLQVSDLGEQADPQGRFETAFGALQFDERSQPVYDYIVALHAAAAEAQPEAAEGEAEVEAEAEAELMEAGDEPDFEMGEEGDGDFDVVDAGGEGVALADGDAMLEGATPEMESLEIDAADEDEAPAPRVSMIPKGMLQRPAIAMHWKPAPAQSPQASPASGLFQYNGSGLPVPAEPPRPELDPSLWVQPAGRPAPEGQAVSEAPAAEYAASEGGADAEFEVDAAAAEGSDIELAEDYASDEASTDEGYEASDDGAQLETSADATESGEYQASEDGEHEAQSTEEVEEAEEAGDEYADAEAAEEAGDEYGEQPADESASPDDVEVEADAPAEVTELGDDEGDASEPGDDVAMEEGEVL